MQNNLTKLFTGCALTLALTACDKEPEKTSAPTESAVKPAEQAAKPVAKTSFNIGGKEVTLPQANRNGVAFLQASAVADAYRDVTFCYDFTDHGCKATETLAVQTADRIQLLRITFEKIDATYMPVAQNLLLNQNGEYGKNPGWLTRYKQILTVAGTGLCRTKEQMQSDIEDRRSQVIADANNIEAGGFDISTDISLKAAEDSKKRQDKQLGDIFCAHYVLDEKEKVLLEYNSVDGVLQGKDPSRITLVRKTEKSALFLSLER